MVILIGCSDIVNDTGRELS